MNPLEIQRATLDYLIEWMATADFRDTILDNLPFNHPLLDAIWNEDEAVDVSAGVAVFEETLARIVHNLQVERNGL